eukprot:GHVQ01037479.1.p1 GENE.GHVQ01037479.1~~GHVQ01037479.1.p1  ORF type:complete len:673 (+),score=105.75 GHVQ01037479.1:390-2408(+)
MEPLMYLRNRMSGTSLLLTNKVGDTVYKHVPSHNYRELLFYQTVNCCCLSSEHKNLCQYLSSSSTSSSASPSSKTDCVPPSVSYTCQAFESVQRCSQGTSDQSVRNGLNCEEESLGVPSETCRNDVIINNLQCYNDDSRHNHPVSDGRSHNELLPESNNNPSSDNLGRRANEDSKRYVQIVCRCQENDSSDQNRLCEEVEDVAENTMIAASVCICDESQTESQKQRRCCRYKGDNETAAFELMMEKKKNRNNRRKHIKHCCDDDSCLHNVYDIIPRFTGLCLIQPNSLTSLHPDWTVVQDFVSHSQLQAYQSHNEDEHREAQDENGSEEIISYCASCSTVTTNRESLRCGYGVGTEMRKVRYVRKMEEMTNGRSMSDEIWVCLKLENLLDGFHDPAIADFKLGGGFIGQYGWEPGSQQRIDVNKADVRGFVRGNTAMEKDEFVKMRRETVDRWRQMKKKLRREYGPIQSYKRIMSLDSSTIGGERIGISRPIHSKDFYQLMKSWRQEDVVGLTCQGTLGYRICGMSYTTADHQLVHYGRDDASTNSSLITFWRTVDFFRNSKALAMSLHPRILKLRKWINSQRLFSFYATSLFVVYERSDPSKCDVRWLDFAHAVRRRCCVDEDNTDRTTQQSTVDNRISDGALVGLDVIIFILSNIINGEDQHFPSTSNST